ncbi:hypothetical protein BAUCODRAFT_27467 [Baudoinia panamericana UAMH 10762]|uniref:Uncharacterized protein n=1 Tax=Baudoinia panamericana (strain UAMH 10762) TaxID=717646 RepID=M2N0I0_BAUPA|nr:uncharacterized protein BAUCODRAFT_27467 [Baudoinia panamericana UAMH 10762]EMC92115.1 hypothetical protein BAUCODRAFT_27467 [Baudoinia panamericana UAMH 10762]
MTGLHPLMYDHTYTVPQTRRHYFTMYTPRAQTAFRFQQFFFEQKAKLSNLLNTVGQDAKAAPFPICMDYPELTSAITQLLCDAQAACGLTYDQIQQAGIETGPFAEKVEFAENVAADIRMRAMSVVKPATVLRKRGRRVDEEEEASVSFAKRSRNAAADYDMVIEPNQCAPYADPLLLTAMWTQPMCL